LSMCQLAADDSTVNIVVKEHHVQRMLGGWLPWVPVAPIAVTE
jgi:hypothetical protein